MYPQFIAVGFTLYLNLKLKKKSAYFSSVWDLGRWNYWPPIHDVPPKTGKWLLEEKKKRKEKRKQTKAAPAGVRLCLGSWTWRNVTGASALPRGSVQILGSLTGNRGQICRQHWGHNTGLWQVRDHGPAMMAKHPTAIPAFLDLSDIGFLTGSPSIQYALVVVYQMCISGQALYMSVLTKFS